MVVARRWPYVQSVELSEYQAWTDALVQSLAPDHRVLGIVAVGSMARKGTEPDRWSDHDFFVVTQPHEQASFRAAHGWLPQADRIIYSFQETAHGVKVLYDFGHLLEYAVFDLDELQLARINRYRVLLDRGPVTEAMAQIAEVTTTCVNAEQPGLAWSFGQFLTNLFVGVGRHRRGERLSGHRFVKSHALGHLLYLLQRLKSPDHPGVLDNLDGSRRFERAYPQVGDDVARLLLLPTPACARGLLDLCLAEIGPALPPYPPEAAQVVLDYIGASGP